MKKNNDIEKSNLKKNSFINTLVFSLAILVIIIFRNNLENVDNYWKNLYIFFDMLIPIQ